MQEQNSEMVVMMLNGQTDGFCIKRRQLLQRNTIQLPATCLVSKKSKITEPAILIEDIEDGAPIAGGIFSGMAKNISGYLKVIENTRLILVKAGEANNLYATNFDSTKALTLSFIKAA
ncbi:hypothetical protein [Limnovirga soli]|uniref:Uncharacterized protein n=1 Tax=Limnovirga soli TaxID=2656915 RepID=A0A8J8FH14_9BACT|nr:hypothetical protein [Limnovirga soli]NNV57267.1 hypothetical protein [Limnovirga soli]